MIQKLFIENAALKIKDNPEFLGLAVGGSWITNDIDDYSDLDLIVVTKDKITNDKKKMFSLAESFGDLLNAFTGEHIGEERLLICLFDNPLIHVDIKFLILDEFNVRVEDPYVFWEKDNCLTTIINSTGAAWPELDFQWIEDRFWTWVHYAALKLGRGEYFEALDFISYLRVNVTAPLLQIKNGNLPRGLRKVEFNFKRTDIDRLIETVPAYSAQKILSSLEKTINLYKELRQNLFTDRIVLHFETELKVLDYFYTIKKQVISRDE
jgi:hypothetical protein